MKTLIIAGLLLVLSVNTASAECAWVLWRQGAGSQWETVQGYGSKKECHDAQMFATKTFGDVYSCLPDTVDPRGAKGR
jgi:hypothetical protein